MLLYYTEIYTIAIYTTTMTAYFYTNIYNQTYIYNTFPTSIRQLLEISYSKRK